jgi:CHAT domain-containing protein
MADPVSPKLPDGVVPSEPLRQLPRAADEARAIAKILRAGPENILLGPKATRAAVLEASKSGDLRRSRVIHFGAHATNEPMFGTLPGLMLGQSGGDDGYLAVTDIVHLDLDSELVVLSACASGGGRIYNGEGVRGLTTSFLVAGGRAVVCSLWPVDDDETAAFMEAFYRRVEAGRTPMAALRETRRDAFETGKLPSTWAAFVLVGR